MTISSTLRKAGPYPGTGTTDTFAFAFKIFTASDLKVVRLQTSTSTETVLDLTTDYTATLNADQNGNPGGSITLTAGNLASGYSLTLTSQVEPLQQTDLTNQGGFYPEVINDALDKAVIQIQQIQDAVDRSIKVSTTNTITTSEFTETPSARASKVLAFDAAGDLSVAQELGQYQGDWTSGNSYNPRDFVKDALNGNVYLALTAHTASGTTPLKDNAQISNWALIVDNEQAGLQANAAAASALEALDAETGAEASAALAVSYRDSAQQAMLTAEGYKTTAVTAKDDAEAAELAAQAAETAAVTAKDEAIAAAESAAASAGGGVVKVTVNDTNANTLSNKIQSGVGIAVNIKNAGADEVLEISSDAIVYAIALG